MPPQRTAGLIGAHRDDAWTAASELDPRRTALLLETAIHTALGRNSRLDGDRITVTAGAEGLVTLTGSVPTQALRREVELSCWTVPGVWTLHDALVVGRTAVERGMS